MKTHSEQLALLERIFKVLQTGTPGEVRRARRELVKLLRDADVGADLGATPASAENSAALRELVLKTIQNRNEPVRDAAVMVGDWLNESIRRRRAVEEYKEFVRAIELLIDYFDDGQQDEAQYIDEMEPSPQKSLEMLLDRVTHGGYELEITHIAPAAMLARREKLETKIADLLDATHSDFCFHDVLDAIYREEGPEDFEAAIEMFDGAAGASGAAPADRLDEVVAIVNDAWNYFPHAALDGLCPAEKIGRAEL